MLLEIMLALNFGWAQPDFSQKTLIDGIVLYRDAKEITLFYYAPGELKLITDATGKPDFQFVQMRYTGTKATGDQGSHRFNSILKFGVSFSPIQANTIEKIKTELTNREFIKNITLTPLPLKRIEANLVYASLSPDNKPVKQTIKGGFFESEGKASHDKVWTQKRFSLRLDDHTSQAFREAFHQKRSVLSVQYALLAEGIISDTSALTYSGDSAMVADFRDHLNNDKDTTIKTTTETRIIYANAFGVEIDHQRFPDLLTQIDINNGIPPAYAALDVYCFDFNNEIRDDLFAKKIEIRATGVGRGMVSTSVSFKSTDKDTYARSIRFPYGVRMDKPLTYRIIEVNKEGEIKTTPWQNRKSWNEILDLTGL